MPLQIVRNDITKMEVDAIVNAANESLLGGGGVDGAIHRAAGEGLLAECRTLGGCKTGMAKITGGYNLPAKYVIHTVGPIYKDGNHGERELLESAYRKSLTLASEQGCKTVAFPLISSGAYRYPKDQALKVAIDVIGDFLLKNEMTVYLVIFDRASYSIGEKLFSDITEYINDNYVEDSIDYYLEHRRILSSYPPNISVSRSIKDYIDFDGCESDDLSLEDELDEKLKCIDESFSEMLLRLIDERGMTDVECYKRANVDRKLFSKIRTNPGYKPSKSTALAFAISLRLTLEETEDFLKKAGYALSHSNKFDIIIEYFISKGKYNIFEINEVLFAFDQSLVGM